MKRTHYSVLHVLHNDTPEIIREAYRKVRKAHEPGLLAHDKAIIAEAKLAKEAFETLIDPARKSAYDSEMSLSTSSFTPKVEVKRVPFWNLTRILVWSSVAVLVFFWIFFSPEKPAQTNSAPYLKKLDQSPKPVPETPPAEPDPTGK